MQEYAGSLSNLGIVENDCYEFRHYIPTSYALNSLAFDSFQTALDIFTRSADSCFKYFEQPLTKGGYTKWHSIFQTHKSDTNAYRNGQWVWDPIDRWPTREEIKVQAWLALSRGAKGIKYFIYFSSPPNLSTSLYNEKLWGLVDENRVPRSKEYDLYRDKPDSAQYRIYDWVKEVNTTVNALAPVLANLTGQYAFGVNTRYGQPKIPQDFYIDSVNALNPAYRQYNYFEVGGFKDLPGNDYFILVNRYCQPEDTVEVRVKLNYTPLYTGMNYFIVDALNNETLSEILPRSVDTSFTIKLLPGGGRLLRIIPFQSTIMVDNNIGYTNFRFVNISTVATCPYPLTVDSIKIDQRYWVSSSQDSLKTGTWLPDTNASIQYLQSSVNNLPNIFEVQYKIDGGKITTPKSAGQIYFNNVPPAAGAITLNGNVGYTNDTLVSLTMSGTDDFPGLSKRRFDESPFGNDLGYENLVKNAAFDDTTGWVLDNAEFYNGFLHLKGYYVGPAPAPAQIGSSALQTIPGAEISKYAGKLLRLNDDIYSHDVMYASKTVDVYYADTLAPYYVRLFEKTIASMPDVIWKSRSDTFTVNIDSLRPIDRMEIRYYIDGIEVPPPDDPPDADGAFNTIAVDNIRLEPVIFINNTNPPNEPVEPLELIPGVSYIYDGWGSYVDTASYQLSSGDGTKRIYMQLKDLANNASYEPGWYDDIVLDMTEPMVGITSPADNSYISGIINIWGYVADANISQWTLEYNYLGVWHTFSSGTDTIPYETPQILYAWNTKVYSTGSYLLRLTGLDRAGNLKADSVYVNVIRDKKLPKTAIDASFITFGSSPVDGTMDALGNIYITDTQNDKIRKYSPNGDSLLCFGYKYFGDDTLGPNHSKGIAVDDSGYIWVSDCFQSKVKKYDSLGNYLRAIGKYGDKPGEFNQPAGIAISGGRIYVADCLNNRVQVFKTDGSLSGLFGSAYLNQPAGIAIRQVEAGDLIYVSDSKHNRIVVFDAIGNLLDTLGIGLGLNEPWDICFDCNKRLYIADVYNNQIVQLDPWGGNLLSFGVYGSEDGEFNLPQGLAVSPEGRYLYVVDTYNERVQRFDMFFDPNAILLASPRHNGVDNIELPKVFKLGQCYPNPTVTNTTIEYALPKQENVTLKVYNTLGQAVKTLVDEKQQPGYYSINWDGRDGSNRKVANGIYFYRLNGGEFSATKKMVVLR